MSSKLTREEFENSLLDVLRDIVLEYLAINIICHGSNDDGLFVIYEGQKYISDNKITFNRRFDSIITICCTKIIEMETTEQFLLDFSEKILHDCTTGDLEFSEKIGNEIDGYVIDRNSEIKDQYVSKDVILKWINEGIVNSLIYTISYEIDLDHIEECIQVMKLYGISSKKITVIPLRCYHQGKDDIKELDFNDIQKNTFPDTKITCNLSENKCNIFCQY